MDVTIFPAPLGGTLAAVGSKSDAHRALICAALAQNHRSTDLLLSERSRDIDATVGCLRALGAGIEPIDGGMRVTAITQPQKNALLDCGESGSTLRFLLPVAAALGCGATLTGAGRLPERPMGPLMRALAGHGCILSAEGTWPIEVQGRLTSGHFLLPGNISSQFATGLLLAASVIEEPMTVELLPLIESGGYLEMTICTLARFGIFVAREGNCFTVNARARCAPAQYQVEGDWSNAAFWLAAGILGRGVTITGLNGASPQGDRAVMTLLQAAGGTFGQDGGQITAQPGRLTAQTIEAAQIPDLVPILAVAAALSDGVSEIIHAGRLRQKESDRLSAMTHGLNALGARVTERTDGLRIEGVRTLTGGVADGCNDHRIVMALAVAASSSSGPVTITGAQAVQKSYPAFWEDYERLGGKIHVK